MAVRAKVGLGGDKFIEPVKKKTRQGCSTRTKLSATSSSGRRKRYRGQGKK